MYSGLPAICGTSQWTLVEYELPPNSIFCIGYSVHCIMDSNMQRPVLYHLHHTVNL